MYALQHFYLPSPIHSRFINQNVLQRYMPVGGVRIEDDILITSRGYENLTKAPKGDAMFDVIRGRKSTSSAAHAINAHPSVNVSEPPLFRAPGCPVRATPPGPYSVKRAATMPNQTSESQRAIPDHRNDSANFRRSMTTDERVQHWRRSHQQHSPRRPTAFQEKPNTVCGAFTNDVRHIFIGDGSLDSSSTRSLPQCTDCGILAQTLERLRQNLALSKQGSPTQAHILQDSLSNDAVDKESLSSARHDLNAPSGKTKETSFVVLQQGSLPLLSRTEQGNGVVERATARKSLDRISRLQETQGHQPRAAVSIEPEALSSQEPESYYRSHEQCQDPLRQRSTTERTIPTTYKRILGSPMSMPIRARMVQQQERRRPSNYTDDRDWMA